MVLRTKNWYKMGNCQNKKQIQTLNAAFDLIDHDGDHKLSQEELTIVSDVVHRYHVLGASNSLERLRAQNPTEYVYTVLGKKPGTRLKRRDFNQIAYTVDISTWRNHILPVLRKAEIQKLQNY
jgi:hypothetical protein